MRRMDCTRGISNANLGRGGPLLSSTEVRPNVQPCIDTGKEQAARSGHHFSRDAGSIMTLTGLVESRCTSRWGNAITIPASPNRLQISLCSWW